MPIILLVFDLLHLNGRSLLGRATGRTPPPARSPGKLPAPYHPAGRRDPGRVGGPRSNRRSRGRVTHGNEGLIIKDPASLYTPGRRGLAWLKLKKELATLDVVVVGAEWGHGKRNSVLSDYTFAVRDDRTGELKTIGKAYSGLTDMEILELTAHFQQNILATRAQVPRGATRHRPGDRVRLHPTEHPGTPAGCPCAFRASRRCAGDKTPAEIDTLSYARTLCVPAGGVIKRRGGTTRVPLASTGRRNLPGKLNS